MTECTTLDCLINGGGDLYRLADLLALIPTMTERGAPEPYTAQGLWYPNAWGWAAIIAAVLLVLLLFARFLTRSRREIIAAIRANATPVIPVRRTASARPITVTHPDPRDVPPVRVRNDEPLDVETEWEPTKPAAPEPAEPKLWYVGTVGQAQEIADLVAEHMERVHGGNVIASHGDDDPAAVRSAREDCWYARAELDRDAVLEGDVGLLLETLSDSVRAYLDLHVALNGGNVSVPVPEAEED